VFQTLYSTPAACRRHSDGPFADERDRYLRHCADFGATRGTLRQKGNELLWFAHHLGSQAQDGVDPEKLQEIASERQSICKGRTAGQRLINIARPWLRFLGWWHVPAIEIRFQNQLDQFVAWMRDERGLSPATIERWHAHVGMFLHWCDQTNRQLLTLRPDDIDNYFVSCGPGRWSRVSVSHVASALRVFLRFMAARGGCDPRLAETIRGPRIYRQESLPYAPDWTDVRRLLADTLTDKPRDVRDRAILMLLAIYGLRGGEVASLRLEQIDWCGRVLRIFRLKRRQAQVYPLIPSVAEALARYIDTVRPRTSYQEIFLRIQAPWHPIGRSSIYDIVNRRFVALGVPAAHRGPHALRHACAARLVADGLTLKEIGDHLGHRSSSSTRIYAKVDIRSLREVGDFDLGDLQ
jgi:site-specific recombinase XerD